MKNFFNFLILLLLLIPNILLVGCQPKNNFDKITTYSNNLGDVISIHNRAINIYQMDYGYVLDENRIQLGYYKGRYSLEQVPFSGKVYTYFDYKGHLDYCWILDVEYINGRTVSRTWSPSESVRRNGCSTNVDISNLSILFNYKNEDDLYPSSNKTYTNCGINGNGSINLSSYTNDNVLNKIEYNEYDSEINIKRDNGDIFPIKIKEENYFPCENKDVLMKTRMKKLDSVQIINEYIKIPHYSYE